MLEFAYSKNDKAYMKLGLFLFRLTLDFMYMYILQHEYANISMLSMGYKTGAYAFEGDFLKILISYVFTFFFVEIVVSKIICNDKPHELITLALLCTSILPNLTMFAYSNVKWKFFFIFIIFWMWMLFVISKMCRDQQVDSGLLDMPYKNKQTNGVYLKSGVGIFWCIAIIFVIGSIILSYLYYGRFYINLSFDDTYVYVARVSARGAFGTIVNYFRNNAMYVVIPLLANVFLLKRKYLFFIICIVTLFLLFSVDSQKAVLMLALVSIFAASFIKRKTNKLIVTSMLGINIIVIVIYLITDSIIFVDYLVKRIYFLPAIIGKCHYEYVQNHGYILFMSSFLQKLNIISDYAYSELPLPYALGSTYFGSPSISANTGGFGGAYAYGWAGIFLIPIIYGYLFKILNKVTTNIKEKYYISFIIVMTFMIVGATVTSVILVYGYVLGVGMLYIMNNTNIFEKVPSIKLTLGREKI